MNMTKDPTYGHYTSGEVITNGTEYHATYRDAPRVPWSAKGLKITRVRMLSDPGFPWWDVTYCYGEIDGKPVNVDLPFHQLNKRKWKSEAIEHAKRDGVYLKGINFFNAVAGLM